MKYDFAGWATKANMRCSDGLTIMDNAFADNDGETVPLVWNHEHSDANNVLGHAMLQNRNGGVYAYCTFNKTPNGQNAKEMVKNGDITQLSIYANKLKKRNNCVMHGDIKEVSLVLAGANPGAHIEDVICHGDIMEDQGVIFTGEDFEEYEGDFELHHADENQNEEETIAEVYNSLTPKQKKVVEFMIGSALEDNNMKGEGENNMKQNAFSNKNNQEEEVLSHSEMTAILDDARRSGSLRESVLAHGITNIDLLFPDYQNVDNKPTWITRDMGWVDRVMKSVHHTPFSRIKSMAADLTEDDARARGYIKGNLKKEQVFSLLKRTTDPQTIYKKQKIDRDDAVDITDFDVVAWIKEEMRFMLNEEIARAILIGDGRLASSDDKIKEDHIRPIVNDAALYTIQKSYDVKDLTDSTRIKEFMRSAVKARKDYKGSGSPTLYTTEDMLTDMLLLEDNQGRLLFDSVEKIKAYLRVSDIVTVPPMENFSYEVDHKKCKLDGIIVNLNDYNVGADKGGAVSMFDDFDIDYNRQKYLIETRCSGALTKPYSAIAISHFNSSNPSV